ncbi:MAG: DUF1552 domain-containing protein [Planctomycetales bacterium]|nr:DUF1552 domain-containing protein [Planctomycetales bacterium]
MTASWRIDRRTFLRGTGTAIALPLLDAMAPAVASAGNAAETPVRMAFLYVPNGVIMRDWTPEREGRDYALPATLAPLESVKEDLLVLSGLAHDKAKSNGDGGGDHARSVATFLTGCQAYKTAGKDIRAGVSVDQVAAQHIGEQTKLPSLELGCQPGRQAGSCDSGYSCAYSSNISWRGESTPMPKEVDPRAVFDRLFGDPMGGDSSASSVPWRERHRRSVLDFALADAKRLHARLGSADQRKLDEYLTSVRELERRVDRETDDETYVAEGDRPLARPKGVPGDFGAHARLMGDLMAMAFQLDLTRVATFMLADAGSNRNYRTIDVPEGHHQLSHHGNDEEKMQKIQKIDRFHIEQFAHLLRRLKSIREGDGTLLDHSMIVYGSGISDGNRHRHNDLPILLAGRGNGTIATGRHVRYDDDTPLMNLYLALLERAGVQIDRLGDSNGKLAGLNAA